MTHKKSEQEQANAEPGDKVAEKSAAAGHAAIINGEPRTMPSDFTISLQTKGDTDHWLMNPGSERHQSMRGFEEQYVDIVDYILRITHRIWEEKMIGYIYDTYRHNSRVYDEYGLQYGRDKIVADTVHTINAFPDIRLYTDEVIWAGDDQRGFHTSHRLRIIGRNTGYSAYGPPTGRQTKTWCIANCVVLENEIFEEWVIYDTASLVRQLGFDLREKAREFGNQLDLAGIDARYGEAERLQGQGKPRHLTATETGDFDVEQFVHHTQHTIWNWRMPGYVNLAYIPSLRMHGPTGRELYGRGEYKSFILSIMAMFPDLTHQVDDIYWMGNDQEGYLVSVRWSIIGTHLGAGIYGPPSGRHVTMWGISQQHIREGQVLEEWMLFNEFAVLQQIYRDQRDD